MTINRREFIAALSAEASLRSQREIDQRDAGLIIEGRRHLRETLSCTDCHQFRKPDEEATAPEAMIRLMNSRREVPPAEVRAGESAPATGAPEL